MKQDGKGKADEVDDQDAARPRGRGPGWDMTIRCCPEWRQWTSALANSVGMDRAQLIEDLMAKFAREINFGAKMPPRMSSDDS